MKRKTRTTTRNRRQPAAASSKSGGSSRRCDAAPNHAGDAAEARGVREPRDWRRAGRGQVDEADLDDEAGAAARATSEPAATTAAAAAAPGWRRARMRWNSWRKRVCCPAATTNCWRSWRSWWSWCEKTNSSSRRRGPSFFPLLLSLRTAALYTWPRIVKRVRVTPLLFARACFLYFIPLRFYPPPPIGGCWLLLAV